MSKGDNRKPTKEKKKPKKEPVKTVTTTATKSGTEIAGKQLYPPALSFWLKYPTGVRGCETPALPLATWRAAGHRGVPPCPAAKENSASGQITGPASIR